MEERYQKLKEEREELLREREFHREIEKLLVHDLKSPVAKLNMAEEMLDNYLGEIRDAKDKEERNKKIFEARRFLRVIGSSGRKVSDLAEILKLSDITPETLKKDSQKFNLWERLDETIQSYGHEMISQRELGLELYFQEDIKDWEVNTNISAIRSIFSNVVGNAIQYAPRESVIKSSIYKNSENLIFELENMVTQPIDIKELKQIFEKGYRLDETQTDINRRNEGLGLYFVEKAIKKGYQGKIEVSSDNSFQITEEKTKALSKKSYGINYSPFYETLPSFHMKLSIPRNSLV